MNNRVMERLSVANIKFNLNKCSFARQDLIALGFKVLKARINLNLAKVQGISDLQPPVDILGVKQILGMFNFY